MRCYIQRTCCTCHTNVNVLMSVFASFIQGPWNPLGWKAPGACKGLMTGFRCYYPPTETPAIKGAEGEFSAWSTQVRSSFCCFRRPPQEWPRAQRKEEGKENNNTPNDNGMGETMLPNAVLKSLSFNPDNHSMILRFPDEGSGPRKINLLKCKHLTHEPNIILSAVMEK